jgi:hypothetical protein
VPQAQAAYQLQKPASAPQRSYGHRLKLNEGTSPQGLTIHCKHKAAYVLFFCCTATVHPGYANQYFSFLLSEAGNENQMLESRPQVALKLLWHPIFLGILVKVAFLTNVWVVSDQTFEAGNRKCLSELHARSGLRFAIRHQEDV